MYIGKEIVRAGLSDLRHYTAGQEALFFSEPSYLRAVKMVNLAASDSRPAFLRNFCFRSESKSWCLGPKNTVLSNGSKICKSAGGPGLESLTSAIGRYERRRRRLENRRLWSIPTRSDRHWIALSMRRSSLCMAGRRASR